MRIELVLGLGNPGEQYDRTRHNTGFRVVDEMQRRQGGGLWVRRGSCELAITTFGRWVALAQPFTFMNRSGGAAAELLADLEIGPASMLVVVDDVDLPLGTLRLRPSGGPGTHNGLRDLCRTVGTGFPRLRVGVGGGGQPADLAAYVLSAFDPDELETVEKMVARAADATEFAVREGLERAMNRYN
jgi:PTH1 family peptidyl-tRNA hydrolase